MKVCLSIATIAVLALSFAPRASAQTPMADAAASPVREFDARITAVHPNDGSFSLRHNATQFQVALKTDKNTIYTRHRQAMLNDFPSGKLMRFWGVHDPKKSTMEVVGIRRAAADDKLKPEFIPAQHYVGGRLVRENGEIFIQADTKRITVTVNPSDFGGYFEEQGSAADLQPGRQVKVRYQEEAQGGRAISVVVTVPLPRPAQQTLPSSRATPKQVRQTFAEIKQLHEKLAPELARLMPVTMTVSPELAKAGEKVTLKMEALAGKRPNGVLEFYPDFLATEMKETKELKLAWKAAGQRHGLTVYNAECPLPTAKTGNYLLHWKCDIGGDIPEFWRTFAVIDNSYAVCMFLSTSNGVPRPASDLNRLHLPHEEWIGEALVLNNVLQCAPKNWADWSRETRQFGMKVNPHLYGQYWVRGPIKDPQANFQAESPERQKAILAGYHEMLPWLGFGPIDIVSAYTMDNSFCLRAKEAGFKTIASLCPGQNFMDGPMRINHFGMPERPYFVSPEDFRKPGPGGPRGFVGVSQCARHTFLNREFNCTYVLEPAWNEFYNEGGGRGVVDDIWMSRVYDFFDAMLQNRLSQNTPYFFNVGLEFNGRAPGITEGNRMLIEYAAKKAKAEPLVFATGPAVTEYYRHHFTETPETTCYLPDFFGGQTNLNKFPGYPDTLEIEGPAFQSLLRAPEILPVYHYDYLKPWHCPAWGNDDLPRNQWGYLYPGQHDPYQVVPKIVDKRLFEVKRADAAREGALVITLTVQAKIKQKNLALALWDIPREWRKGEDWWSVAGQGARFVPVRAPFTANLNGLLIADIAMGQNKFTVTIKTPARKPVRSTVKLAGGTIEGRVFERDSQLMAYLWPTKPWASAFVVNLPVGKQADAYIAPAGEHQALKPGENRFEIPAGRWMRLVGLSAEEIAPGVDASSADPI